MLQYIKITLKYDSVGPPNMVLYLKIILTILVHFHSVCIWGSICHFLLKHNLNFNLNCLNICMILQNSWHIFNIESCHYDYGISLYLDLSFSSSILCSFSIYIMHNFCKIYWQIFNSVVNGSIVLVSVFVC